MTGTVRQIELPFTADLRAVTFANKAMVAGGEGRAPGVWWPVETPDGIGTLHLQREDDAIRAEAWGPGTEWLLDQTPRLLGVDDHPETFVSHHDVVTELLKRRPPLRFCRTDRVFEALLPTILGQKVQTTIANQSLRNIVRTYGEPAPGPVELRAFPSAARMAEIGYHELHRFHVERKRADTIIRAAKAATRLERVTDLAHDQVAKHLGQVRGIGPWSIGWIGWTALGDADAVPVGDFHIPNNVVWALAGEPRATDERMMEMLEPYEGHRGRVVRMIKGTGETAPKYGPRLSIQKIAHL